MTKYINVTTTGPVSWAKVFEHNRDREGYKGAYKVCDGAYTVNQELTKEEYQKLKDAGSLKKPIQKFLMDGQFVVKHERKHSIPQAPQAGGQPKITDKYGQEWTYGNIGNGSICEIESLVTKFTITDPSGETKEVSRTTMKSIKVLEAKLWDSDNQEIVDFTPPAPNTGSQKSQSPVNKPKISINKPTPVTVIDEIDNDEIPF